MMAQQGLNVPPGFTITTEACNEYRLLKDAAEKQAFLTSLMTEVEEHMEWLKEQFGYMPLVSVRSGAPISMPGMMDTILNVGLTADNTIEWNKRIGDRPAADSVRRLIQMLGSTGYGVDMGVFDFQLAAKKKEFGAKQDTDLNASQLWAVAEAYLKAFEANKGFVFPVNDAKEQLRVAIAAVFDSWMNPRAIEYRKINKIDEKMGTAVNVQAMVFGNMGDRQRDGRPVLARPVDRRARHDGRVPRRRPGRRRGRRHPHPGQRQHDAGGPPTSWTGVHAKLVKLCADLEVAYKDMVDIEFTVQKGELFVLQSRAGKRSAPAPPSGSPPTSSRKG